MRVARHLVIAVGAEGGDLQPVAALADADRAEFDTGVPQRIRPGAHDALDGFRPGVGGEVEVGIQPAQDRVADAAADQVEVVAGRSEQAADFAQHLTLSIERDEGPGEQLDIVGGFGHVA